MRFIRLAPALLVLAVMAAPAPAQAASASNCVTVIPSGGDIGEKFCVNESDCLVAEYRTTFLGTERICLVDRPVAAATSESSTGAQRCVATYAVQKPYGSKYCVDTEGSCTVFSYQTTIFGTAYTCHVRKP
jgi:hypothetical protein